MTRGVLLEKISAAAKGKKGAAAVTAWQKIQNDFILSNLKTAQPDEVEWLTGVVKKHDINFFRNALLPQLRNQRYAKKFWFLFIEVLNREKSSISTLEVAEAISLCVRHVVGETPAYPQKPYDFRDEDDMSRRCACYTEAKFNGDPTVITQLVQLCVDTANIDQCTVIFDRALVPNMTKVVETNSDLRPLFKSFFENAVCEILDQRKDVSESMALALLQVSHEFLTQFLTRERFEILAKESIQPVKSLARCLHSRVLPTLSLRPPRTLFLRLSLNASIRLSGITVNQSSHTAIPSPVHLSLTFWISPMTLALEIL
ncbi:hypothetical protein EDD85DRAFT_308248 [Armillaria nabsnona]|nr:hypothetical protein EDD85DRAFT_308248 [Armillaria nabsnona]